MDGRGRSGETLDGEEPGVLPPTVFLLAIASMVVLHWLVPGGSVVPRGWGFLGLVPLGAGGWLNWAAHSLFERHQTTVKPFGEPSSLIVRGPFRFTRNPMYVGGVLILLGLGLLLGSAVPFLVVPAFGWLVGRWFIRAEEEAMARRFGQEWYEYAGRVRRWI